MYVWFTISSISIEEGINIKFIRTVSIFRYSY